MKNNKELDPVFGAAVAKLDLDEVLKRFVAFEGAAAPVNNIAQVFEDEHFRARENIVSVYDAELGGQVRFQNVVGKLSATPGSVRHAGQKLGESNREILMERLGYSEDQIAWPRPAGASAAE
jgi:formyl-CoA transferase